MIDASRTAARTDPNRTVLLISRFLASTPGSWSAGESLEGELRRRGWSVRTTSSRNGRITRAADMLATVWGLRADYGVAAVDVFSGAAFLWAEACSWALGALRKPYLLTLRGGGLPDFARRHPRRVGRLLRAARRVTTPSRYLLEAMQQWRPDIDLVPNGVDVSRATFRLRSPARARLLWLRAFHEIYNPAMAVETVAALRSAGRPVRLEMVGRDKGLLSQIRRQAQELGVGEQVVLRGPVGHDDVFDLHTDADIFLNTPNVDNTPVSILEAMASGLCIVSTRAGGLPYLLEDGRDALLVERGDASAMAEAVTRILDDEALASGLSLSARRKAEAFDWKIVAERWNAILTGMVGGRA